ncbi:hypothetical protein RISK_006310 [Rhodopirellula islandica]|uniref:Uncharacterized protein n=1 Tax=Rhodopirellula islandica TaxID=595434 RepID=A0A0J1E800_RHOIS|nr:hypothetical protein RISK_006310 [Rhodopirellula islandica]
MKSSTHDVSKALFRLFALAFGLLPIVALHSVHADEGGETGTVPAAQSRSLPALPGQIAFWDFQEDPGTRRRGGDFELVEQHGPIKRVEDGIFGPYAAELKRGQWFSIPREKLGRLNIHGPEAEVTVVAWIKRQSTESWQAIAGVWGETRRKRQYCLFVDGAKAAYLEEEGVLVRHPIRNRVHGHVSAPPRDENTAPPTALAPPSSRKISGCALPCDTTASTQACSSTATWIRWHSQIHSATRKDFLMVARMEKHSPSGLSIAITNGGTSSEGESRAWSFMIVRSRMRNCMPWPRKLDFRRTGWSESDSRLARLSQGRRPFPGTEFNSPFPSEIASVTR